MIKSGKSSTEWWASIMATAIILVNQITGAQIDDTSQIIIAGVVAAYTLGRSIVKAFSGGEDPQ